MYKSTYYVPILNEEIKIFVEGSSKEDVAEQVETHLQRKVDKENIKDVRVVLCVD